MFHRTLVAVVVLSFYNPTHVVTHHVYCPVSWRRLPHARKCFVICVCAACLRTMLLRLQPVQTTAVRIVTQIKRSDHIAHFVRELHWLPGKTRIDYKILSLVYNCVYGTGPPIPWGTTPLPSNASPEVIHPVSSSHPRC